MFGGNGRELTFPFFYDNCDPLSLLSPSPPNTPGFSDRSEQIVSRGVASAFEAGKCQFAHRCAQPERSAVRATREPRGPGRGRQRAGHAQCGERRPGRAGPGLCSARRAGGACAQAARGSRGWGRPPPGHMRPAPTPATPRPVPCSAEARGARCPLITRPSLRTGHGRCTIAGGRGPARAASGTALFVRRKARPSGSGSTRRHFLARSRYRLARSLPPDRD